MSCTYLTSSRLIRMGFVKAFVALLVLIGMGWGQTEVSPSACRDDAVVDIPDIWLERAVKSALSLNALDGSTQVTCGDIKNLTELSVRGADFRISSLDGLEHATNLEVLELPKLAPTYEVGHFVSSLEPLASLTNLKKLEIYLGNVEDLSPLENLQSLKHLELTRHAVENLEPLSQLQNLHTLVLPRNNVSDLEPLETLSGLVVLNLSDNSVRDITPLNTLTNLKVLDLSLNEIVSPNLSGLPPLRSLDLRNSGLTDLSFARDWSLTEPMTLNLGTNLIHDLQPLVDNPAFGEGDAVDLSSNCLDLTPGSRDERHIAELSERGVKMSERYLRRSEMEGCAFLEERPQEGGKPITFSDFRLARALAEQTGYFTVTDKTMAELTRLNLGIEHCTTGYTNKYYSEVTCVSDLAGLEEAVNVQKLVLNTNSLDDLSALSSLPALETLVLQEGGYQVQHSQSLSGSSTKSLCFIAKDKGRFSLDLTPLLGDLSLWFPDGGPIEVEATEDEKVAAENVLLQLRTQGVEVLMVDDPAQCL